MIITEKYARRLLREGCARLDGGLKDGSAIITRLNLQRVDHTYPLTRRDANHHCPMCGRPCPQWLMLDPHPSWDCDCDCEKE
ncbi:hypothetical protein A2V94_07140 [Candidatus Atribacteria bacterium RBG_16_35_8]|nr:MAG: hypothetical protein A2V94_07140 [Candidatus Atribacteria bacterium RBG_16_35_8]